MLSKLKGLGHHVMHVDLISNSRAEALRVIESTFLGQSALIFLGNISALSVADQKYWCGFFAEYKGSNTLWYCLERTQTSNEQAIVIPSAVSFDIIFLLYVFFYDTEEKQRFISFFKKIQERTKALSLDQACLLMQYCRVIGRNGDNFIDEMIDDLIVPQSSLFMLSDAVFQKNKKNALQLWLSMRDIFPVQFWITFWSEQVWRAYWYAYLMRMGAVVDAKKVAYRLPYSFMQKNWRLCILADLKRVHGLLYDIDIGTKGGLYPQGNTMLDLVCINLLESR